MTDFGKILDKAKELENKMKESQENIKKIRVEGVSGANSVKVILDGEGNIQKIEISDEIFKENKIIKLAIGNKSTINRFLINGMNNPNSMSIIPGCNRLLVIVILRSF